ncbi:putative phage abortive infection protein [Haemophilus sputorum]|nr:putative phage abortive infection protein [Haemophilus sputorum]
MLKEIWDFIKNNKWYVLLVMGLLGLYFYQFHGGLSSESEKWDHFGSYVGGIFSAVTLLSVLHGMQLERKRFNEQRIEFENEKKEQEERRKKEDFERTFFMMLEQHNLKLNTLGQETIDEVYDKIISNSESFDSLRNKIEIQEKSKTYSEINSYFLLLYRILKFISENKELNYKNNYSSLLRSFLSHKLLVVLSYHLSNRDDSYGEYIIYVNDFSFLEHINFIDLELEFIHQVSHITKKTLYSLLLKKEKYLLDNLYKGELIQDDQIRENFLKEIIQSKQDKRPIAYKKFLGCTFMFLQDGEILTVELKYEDNIIFQILKTFFLSAFGKNKEYAELILIYQNIITQDKE